MLYIYIYIYIYIRQTHWKLVNHSFKIKWMLDWFICCLVWSFIVLFKFHYSLSHIFWQVSFRFWPNRLSLSLKPKCYLVSEHKAFLPLLSTQNWVLSVFWSFYDVFVIRSNKHSPWKLFRWISHLGKSNFGNLDML